MTDLLDAVDALTLPTHTLVVQTITINGRETEQSTRIEHPPLLTQLEDAIRGVMDGSEGGAATVAFTRSVLNAAALQAFMVIDGQIREWCQIEKATVSNHPGESLRSWYAARLSRLHDDDGWHVKRLRRWESTILTTVQPPRTLELTVPCPACGSDTWLDFDGAVYRHPVQVSYREGDADILRDARASCRSCSKTWRGSHELRLLTGETVEETV